MTTTTTLRGRVRFEVNDLGRGHLVRRNHPWLRANDFEVWRHGGDVAVAETVSQSGMEVEDPNTIGAWKRSSRARLVRIETVVQVGVLPPKKMPSGGCTADRCCALQGRYASMHSGP